MSDIYVYSGLNIIWLLAILFYSVESEAGNIIEIEFERKMHFIERKSEFLFQKKKNLLQIFLCLIQLNQMQPMKNKTQKIIKFHSYVNSVHQKSHLTLFLALAIDSKQ